MDGDKHNAMQLAVLVDDLMTISELLARGVRPSPHDFLQALEQNSKAVLELFLKYGYKINDPIRDDYPPPLAASLFDPELLEWLVREHHANPNARCKFDITPLSIAAQSASLPVIELLFQLGASVKYGQPLHYAVRSNRSNDIIEFLLRKGASPNSIMFEGDAASFHHFQAFGLGTPLHEAVHQGNERLVRLLLQNGAREDIVDTLGRRPGILQ